MFTYFQERGWVGILHRTVNGGAVAMAPGIIEDYPWEELLGMDGAGGLVIDIGGGGGGLIATLLRRFKRLRGGIYDLENFVSNTRTLFHTDQSQFSDVGDPVSPEDLIAGDFFKSMPRFHFYTMKWCLHDWKDEQVLKILNNIHKAMIQGPKSRLVVMETVLGNGRSQRLSRYGDIHIMMMANGQERTEAQWRQLASLLGWDVKNIYTLRNAWVKAIEMVPNDEGHVIGHDDGKVRRLAEQYKWIKASTGSLVQCPINHKNESMRVLDVGTANGYWLIDALSDLPVTTKGFGVDIATHLFPMSPGNIRLREQSVMDPFPSDSDSSFDLVHQRLVLSACEPESARRVMVSLISLVKPGGWIQLMECDHSGGFTEAQKSRYPATVKFGKVVMDAISTTECPVRARAATQLLEKTTKTNILSVIRKLEVAKNEIPKMDLNSSFYDQLHNKISDELATIGSVQRFHLICG